MARWSFTRNFEQIDRRRNKTTIKNECIACFDPVVQFHSCYLNIAREKVDRNFDNAFTLADLWLANEATFENKIQDKIKFKWQSKTKIFV